MGPSLFRPVCERMGTTRPPDCRFLGSAPPSTSAKENRGGLRTDRLCTSAKENQGGYGLIVFVRLPKRIEGGLIVFVLLPKRLEGDYELIVSVRLLKRIVGRLFVFLLKIYRGSYSTYMDLLLDCLDFIKYFIQFCLICSPSDSAGSNPGPLQIWHWQSDAPTTRQNLSLTHIWTAVNAEVEVTK